jgi:signal transduction histidine kinase
MLTTDDQRVAVGVGASRSGSRFVRGPELPVSELARTIGETVQAGGVLILARREAALVPAGVTNVDEAAVRNLLPFLAGVDPASAPAVAELAGPDAPDAAAVGRSGFSGGVYAPLSIDDEDVGLLCLLFRDGKRPAEDVVLSLARHAAVALARTHAEAPAAPVPHARELQAEFDRFAISTASEEELSAKVAEALAGILGAPMSALMVYDDERRVLQMAAGSFGADDERVRSYHISVLDPRSNTARVFATGQPYLSNDAVSDPGIRPAYVDAFGIKRLLSVPLAVGARRIGVLHLANKALDFTLDDLVRAEAVAPRVATVVELARASFRLRREQRLEGVLSQMALGIASGESLQALLPAALDELSAVTGASVVALVPADGRPVVHRRCAARPELEEALVATARAQPPRGAEVVTPQAVGDPGWAAFHAPVELERDRIATLSALRCRAEPFAADERRALARVAQLATLAWATESYQQQASQLARLQERRRVSGELHDDVQQLLVEAQSRLDSTLSDRSVDASATERLRHARGLMIRGFTAIRSVAHHLTRPAACDLPLRLRAATSSVGDEFRLPVRLEISPEAAALARDLPSPLADLVVKAARETLVNAAKHGGGHCQATLSLDLCGDDRLRLTVSDDGVGVCARSRTRGHGLVALRRELREHGGRLEVRAARSGGTRVMAIVPVRR